MMDGVWRKSTFSNDSSSCVEVRLVGELTEVRNSNDPTGPVLTFDAAEWAAFAAGFLAGEFNAR